MATFVQEDRSGAGGEGGEWKRKFRTEIYGDPGESTGWKDRM